MIYLANAFSLGMLNQDSEEFILNVKRVKVEDVKEVIKDSDVTSCIGHESTARVLSVLLDTNIPAERKAITLQRGDVVIVFQLLTRLQEGVILKEEEIKQLPYAFYIVEVE